MIKMMKHHGILTVDQPLDMLSHGMDEVVKKWTIIPMNDCGLSGELFCTVGGVLHVQANPKDDKNIIISLEKNPFLGVLYYRFNDLPTDTIVSASYDWIGDDLLVKLWVIIGTEKGKAVKNGFVNLPAWHLVKVMVKTAEEKAVSSNG